MQVCAHACQPGQIALEEDGGGVWTRAMLRSMEREDMERGDSDIVRVLRQTAKDVYLREAGQAQYWLVREGVHRTCSLPRCANLFISGVYEHINAHNSLQQHSGVAELLPRPSQVLEAQRATALSSLRPRISMQRKRSTAGRAQHAISGTALFTQFSIA